jgi:stage III sporulation protein AF
MTALGDWLKQMVIVVLLAVLTDFLLPTQAMQKYVRTVMSLAIIAIMLGPIVPFMKPDWADEVANMAISEFDRGQTTGSPANGNATETNTSRAYSKTIQAEEASTATTLVQQDVLSAIPTVYKPFVTDVAVQTDGTGQEAVNITCHSLNSMQEQQLATWIATALQTTSSNVHVHE